MLASMHAMGSSELESWGEIGVVDPDVWSIVGSVAGWGEIGVANLGFWSKARSVAGWGEIGVADPGVFGAQSEGASSGSQT